MAWAICLVSALAQPAAPQGSNYDPPPPPTRKTAPIQPPVEPEPEQPFFQLDKIDWSDKSTYVKVALLVGSVILARRAFREMKGDY